MERYPFSALLARQKYIARWGLMRCQRTETVAEHTADTAQLAYLLAVVAAERYGADANPEKVAVAALFHDAGEILTGDLPTPVKYKTEPLKNAYKALEKTAEESLLALLPKDVRGRMAPAVTAEGLNARERDILKAADKLSALIKCMEEAQGGNREFIKAEQSQRQALQKLNLPEVRDFCETMLPCFEETLDQLAQGAF